MKIVRCAEDGVKKAEKLSEMEGKASNLLNTRRCPLERVKPERDSFGGGEFRFGLCPSMDGVFPFDQPEGGMS